MAKPDTIIRGLWEFLQTCPYIEAGSPVTVDCMPMDNNAFTLAKRSGNPIVKMYTDGSSIRQYPFAVWYRGSRCTIQEGIVASGKCELISRWLERQSRDGMLPDLPEGMAAQLIQASDTGKLYTLEPDVYIYEVPCRLQYIQEA